MKKHNLDTSIIPYCFRHTYEYKLEEAETPEMLLRHLIGKPAIGSLNAYSHPNIRVMKTYIEKLPDVENFHTIFTQVENRALTLVAN